MNTKYLLPSRYKKIGWFLFIPSILLGLITLILQFEPPFFESTVFAVLDSSPFGETSYLAFTKTNIFDEVLCLLLIISSLLVAFSKLENEDEYITRVRLESLVWAIYMNYMILILCIVFVFNFAFFYALVLSIFTVLLCFIARFHWEVYRMPAGNSYEE